MKVEAVEPSAYPPRTGSAAGPLRDGVRAAVLHAARAAVNGPSTACSPAGGSVP
jgi:hypothetical protein